MKNTGSERVKKTWPTRKVMDQIYDMNLWGGGETEFYSGDGSHLPALTTPYLEVLTRFLQSFGDPLVVCDLGCGDFNIGKELLPYSKKYIAIDIVEALIQRNEEKYSADHLEFHCLDIAKDTLPAGDCAILRNVLQHISNAEIQQVLNKLEHFSYLILTEHLPDKEFTPNKDIISGQGIRLKKQSGVDITKPPFHFKAREQKQLLSIPYTNGKGVLITTLYTL